MAVLAVALFATQALAEEKPALKTLKDKVSYGIGISIGRSFLKDGIEVNLDLLMKGLKDTLSGAKLLMTDEELQTTMTTFSKEMQQKQIQARAKKAEENKKAGEAYLAENKKKAGVIILPSGLQYKVLTAGTGKRPAENDTVECNYRGMLLNGTEFDSSYKHGMPAELIVSELISGWKEALQLMPVGSKWEIFIPSSLAYGEQGAGAAVGPNSTLIFEVELLSIKDPAAAPAPAPAPTPAPAPKGK
jgi:FKBP-type peptidyl-prolyl cis-trans isomerase FklB